MQLLTLFISSTVKVFLFWISYCLSHFYERSDIFVVNLSLTQKQDQKQPPRGVLRESYSENMEQVYRRTLMWKSDFNKVALQLYWNHTSARVFSCKFAAYFQFSGNLVLRTRLNDIFSKIFKIPNHRIYTTLESIVCNPLWTIVCHYFSVLSITQLFRSFKMELVQIIIILLPTPTKTVAHRFY